MNTLLIVSIIATLTDTGTDLRAEVDKLSDFDYKQCKNLIQIAKMCDTLIKINDATNIIDYDPISRMIIARSVMEYNAHYKRYLVKGESLINEKNKIATIKMLEGIINGDSIDLRGLKLPSQPSPDQLIKKYEPSSYQLYSYLSHYVHMGIISQETNLVTMNRVACYSVVLKFLRTIPKGQGYIDYNNLDDCINLVESLIKSVLDSDRELKEELMKSSLI